MNDLTVAATHTYYVIAGNTPVLVHNCGTDPGAVYLDLHYKEGWSPTQIADADGKVAYLNDLAQDGLLVETPSVRVVPGSAAGRLRKAGETVPRGYHGDHMHDLQLGGPEVLDNLGALDGSVNTSLGPQIDARIRNISNGIKICGVSICKRP